MRVRLKGINSIRKKLADGSFATYYYAWKGGPRLDGKPGSPEFVAAYNRAVATKIKGPEGTIKALIVAYERSPEFTDLADRTRLDYGKKLRLIETEFASFPLSGLSDKRARAIFKDWRNKLALTSKRQADYSWTVLSRLFSWAKEDNRIDVNPCTNGGRLYKGSRAESVWTADDEARFLAVASPEMKLAFTLAIETGQRQGDLLLLPWSAYDGQFIRLKQSKTGARVQVPVTQQLKQVLDAMAKVGTLILNSSDKRPWTEDGFRSSWKKTCKKVGIAGLTFHDLRGTAVTRLALAGCTVPEIATITGHSLKDASAILDSNYMSRDPELALSAIRKLEKTRTKTPN